MTEWRIPLRRIMTIITVFFLGFAAVPALAQQAGFEPLFDKFNFRLEGSFVSTDTTIRFDSKELGIGTVLSFEDDLGLDRTKMTPSLSFEWQVGRKHRLGIRWQAVGRNASSQALTEIEWDGEIIPVDAIIDLVYNYETYALDYTYYPWVQERWAAGFGLGLRTLSILASLTVEGDLVGESGAADFTVPLPYVNFEYRRMLSAKWRMKVGLGYFSLAIGDYSGWQGIGRLSFEHRTFKNVGFGAALNGSNVVADADSEDFFGQIEIGINDVSLFIRVRF